MNLELTHQDAKQCGVKVCCSPGGEEQTLVYYDAARRSSRWTPPSRAWRKGRKSVEAGPLELRPDEPLQLRVFVDKSVVEVFANGRQAVMRRIYPSRADSLGVAVFSQGGPAHVPRSKPGT